MVCSTVPSRTRPVNPTGTCRGPRSWSGHVVVVTPPVQGKREVAVPAGAHLLDDLAERRATLRRRGLIGLIAAAAVAAVAAVVIPLAVSRESSTTAADSAVSVAAGGTAPEGGTRRRSRAPGARARRDHRDRADRSTPAASAPGESAPAESPPGGCPGCDRAGRGRTGRERGRGRGDHCDRRCGDSGGSGAGRAELLARAQRPGGRGPDRCSARRFVRRSRSAQHRLRGGSGGRGTADRSADQGADGAGDEGGPG